ncbi:hypothetical protein WA1_05325 [Scytonema hofmannii PCC 7110]|uniref:Filamentous haemagglutinin FhaB/tRNA nuclease CdiA-like TPS domain-containing protein n=1 Tax=Scytonema hofmannii PCC 7110 TaxID=128403 RepID=A0A139WZP2_9CYAN|nr:filamentous hemagglutinin N-terminal domain-containing protein [Scytonema hofmannii]KYC37919.1 hypothetical protein WA1_05325 [Scytonema hofmannii PCC 7110]
MIGKHHWLQERLSFAFLVLIQCGKKNYAVTNSMIFFCLVPSTLCLLAPARAQINPDNTLGVENSRVTPNTLINGLPSDQIDGGAQRGSNLFHSFTQFNVNDGQRVFFTNPLDVKNIFTRVTGGQASNILGTLGVDGNANLFLMNPNGIVFGKNASLNVNGSFVATMANGIQFGNLGTFSATNPEAPSSLLTINPRALFFNQINPTASIQNNSIAPAGKDPTGTDTIGLRVPDGKSLLLIGGNVSMDGGKLKAYGGRVELGGLATSGNVNILFDGDNLRLGFPENVNRADVLLTNQAAINVEGAGGGNIAINARNLEVSGRSIFSAGIARGLGTPETVAGDIALNATGEIIVAGRSSIANDVFLGAKGSGGNITIDTGSFSLRDRAQLAASTFGQGNAGNVTVRAVDAVSLVDSNIFSTVEAGGIGKGGNIDINAASLSLIDNAQLQTSTRGASNTQPAGRGDAGNVNIKVSGNVNIAGQKNGRASGIFSSVDTGTVGNGGNITIDTGSFSLRDEAQLAASTSGQGNAGNVTVRAVDAVSLAGNAGILSRVNAGGVGKGGNIDINAASLSLTDGAQLLTSTRGASNTQPAGRGDAGDVNIKVTGNVNIAGQKNGLASGIRSFVATGTVGNGGNITIDTGSFSLRDRAQLAASTFGQGNAGNVTVWAVDAVSLVYSNIFSTVEAGGIGKGGNIDINAASLSLIDSAQLLTLTRGASNSQPAERGDAGNVNVKVTGNVNIAGQKNGFASGIISSVATGTVGNGGNITIDTGSFSLRDDAQLSASTSGIGNAGNVTVRAVDAVSLVDSNIFSTVEAGGIGKGGNIDINAASLSLDGAQLGTITRRASNTQPAGRGDAGNVNVKVTGNVDIAGQKNGFTSGIRSFVATGTVGNGGNITIDTGSFSLRDGAQLEASTRGQGNAGNVTVRAVDAVSLAGNAGILSTVDARGVGKGGNIDINAASLSLTDGAQLLTITRGVSNTQPAGRGDAGNVNVKVTGNVDIAGQKNGLVSGIGSLVETGTVGNGGNISIDTGSLSLRDSAQLSAATAGQGNAGNVTVRAVDAVSLVDSNIFSTVEAGGIGKGGNIDINAASLSLIDSAQLQTSTRGASNTQPAGRGDAGNVNVKVTGNVDIAGQKNGSVSGIGSFVATGTVGNGGNITIDTGSFSLRDSAQLEASTSGQGNAGDVTVRANIFEALNGGQLITTTSSNGSAGTIAVNATEKVMISGRDPNYNNRQAQLGDRTANVRANSGFFVSSSGSGITGDIEINSPNITLDNQGRLNAESASGNGGNINLNSDLLLLRRGAQITTNAGTEQKGGDGGNININSKFIVAVPQENSDVTANAFQGRGGNINVTAQGIFGIEARPKPSELTNDITASSDLGLSGTINLNSPDNSSLQNSLTQLSQNLVDSNALIASSCIVRSNQKQQNSFTITGTGGLPNRPGDLLVSNYATGSVRNVTYSNQSSSINAGIWKKGDPIIEPQGVYRTTSGQIVLSRECR